AGGARGVAARAGGGGHRAPPPSPPRRRGEGWEGAREPEWSPARWHCVLTAPCHDLAWMAGALALLLALSAPDFPEGAAHTLTAFALAAATWLLVWVNGWSVGSWVGAGVLWAGLTHALVWDVPEGAVARPGLVALLGHATLLMLARLFLPAFVGQVSNLPGEEGRLPACPTVEAVRRRDRINVLFRGPLGRVALLTSLISIPVMVATAWGKPLALAGYVTWLAVLWLAFACMESSPGWFTAFQGALSAAALLTAAGWVESRPWGTVPAELGDPRTLQALGVGLGLLGLVWVRLRLVLRGHEPTRMLLEPPWPAWDRLVLAGVVLGQL